MISEDLDIKIVELLVNDYLEQGWEYSYWGKKIIVNKKDTQKEILEFISKELELEDYDIVIKDFFDIEFFGNIKEFISGKEYYCCLFIDGHDGDSYGVVIYIKEEIVEMIEKRKKAIDDLKILLEEKK